MLWLLFFSLLGSFSLTASYYSLRALGPQYPISSIKSFFFLQIHRKLFSKRATDLLLLALLFSRQLLFFILAATTMAILTTLFPIDDWWHASSGWHHWILLLVALLLCVALVDLMPRLFALNRPEHTFLIVSPVTSAVLVILLPLNYLVLHLPKHLLKPLLAQQWPATGAITQKIVAMLQEDDGNSQSELTNRKLVESVLRFKDRIVREVMLPRIHLFALPSTMTIQEAAEHIVKEGYSRVPVYKENIDHIVGLLMYKDLLPFYMEHHEENITIERFCKPVFYIPETKKVSHLLQEFRARQMHMAIVVDEYGGTEGIVTIEDLLEEIVGEIADEYDEKEAVLYTIDPAGVIIADARMTLFDLEQECQVQLGEEGDYETIGGFIYQQVGAIPKQGFRIFLDNYILEVLSSTDRAIGKIRITPLEKEV